MVVEQPAQKCAAFVDPLLLEAPGPLLETLLGLDGISLHRFPVRYGLADIVHSRHQAARNLLQVRRIGPPVDLELDDGLGRPAPGFLLVQGLQLALRIA